MRIATATDVLETGGALNARKSTIKTSRKMFRMTIDGIYSDKIGSIVREIAANAFDSHLRAKQDRPFYVHCPTVLKPEFFVRDYGVGMTDSVMGEVYIVVGESDKDRSDDEVGMWGLGSKAPFAYADQYTISCFDGETVRHYGYGIDEDGIPTLFLMSVEDSTEPRGVRVGFAVESKDFRAFEEAIKKIAIGHNGAFESNVPLGSIGELAFAGDDWQCYSNCGLQSGRGLRWFARQGCVIYPIDSNQVPVPTDYNSGLTYILDCPIGTVQVTTSRESISYEAAVRLYLTERIERVKAEVRDAIWQQVKDIVPVHDFFQAIAKIKPGFVLGGFTHPLTGLTEAVVKPKPPEVFFNASLTTYGRWEFSTPVSQPLDRSINKRRAYSIEDISPFLDPSRSGQPVGDVKHLWLSKSEMRRLSRFCRAYMEKAGVQDATFFMNVKWADDLWAAYFPDLKVEPVSFDDLRGAIPRRVVPPKEQHKPPIRGIALAKAAGEQKPVFEIDLEGDDAPAAVAWVSSEQYRRQSAALFKLAKRFKVDALYIAAPPAQPMMAEHSIRHLRDIIDEELKATGVSFAAWYYAKEKLTDYNVKNLVVFLRMLLTHTPAAYDKLVKAKGEISEAAALLRPLLPLSVDKLNDDEKRGIDALLLDEAGKSFKPDLPPELVQFDVMKRQFGNNYANPTCKFINDLPETTDPDKLGRLCGALIALQKAVPPSEKFR